MNKDLQGLCFGHVETMLSASLVGCCVILQELVYVSYNRSITLGEHATKPAKAFSSLHVNI